MQALKCRKRTLSISVAIVWQPTKPNGDGQRDGAPGCMCAERGDGLRAGAGGSVPVGGQMDGTPGVTGGGEGMVLGELGGGMYMQRDGAMGCGVVCMQRDGVPVCARRPRGMVPRGYVCRRMVPRVRCIKGIGAVFF